MPRDAYGSLTRCAHDLHAPDAARREEAARQIWRRFAPRLQALVDRRLRRRVADEDVVQSLFASFFAAPEG